MALTTPIPQELEGKYSIDVPLAGGFLDLGRNASYAAAARGDIPTVRIGKKIRVPVLPFLRLLGYDV